MTIDSSPEAADADAQPDAEPTLDTLGLTAQLLFAAESAGYHNATPVQAAAIPAVLAGRDLRVRAETGSGKTLAFALPLLQQLVERPRTSSPRGNPVAALVLVPTRELAIQVADVFATLAGRLDARIKVLAAYGGVKINPQMMALRGGADVVVATPGRLLDLHRKNAVDFRPLRTLVLDEADRMLGLGFKDELDELLRALPAERQSLLFSATLPEELDGLLQSRLRDPLTLDLAEAATPLQIEQQVYEVDQVRKAALLIHLVKEQRLKRVLVFVSEKRSGDKLAQKLCRAGVPARVFHADRSQAERQRALNEFRQGKLRVLVATDLAARGIDVQDLPTVINFQLPRSPNDYIHRIGRTGRAGKSGQALSLICPAEYAHFRVIERRMQHRLPRQQVPSFEVHELEPARNTRAKSAPAASKP